MLSLNQLFSIKNSRLIFFLGVSIFLLAIMGTSIDNVASTVYALLVLTSFFYIRDWVKGWRDLSPTERLFVIGFALYMISGLLAFYNESDVDKYIKVFERFFRFFLIIPFYLLLVKKKISLLNYIYAGAIASGPFILIIALNSYMSHPNLPASGHYHHIMFGELAVLNIGVMLTFLLTHNLKRIFQILVLVSILCALIAAVLSQARGAWLMLPIYLAIVILFSVKEKKISFVNIVAVLALVIMIFSLSPLSNIITKRVDEAVSNVNQYYDHDIYDTSNGQRLAMWHIAFKVWRKNPLLGTGPGDFQHEIVALQKKGQYTEMHVFNSVHNIFVQALVGTGIVGFLIFLFAVIVMPLKVVFSKIGNDKESQLFGFIVICSFAVFGLTESWTLRLPPVSVYLVYVTVMLGNYHSVIVKNMNNVTCKK